MGHVSTRRSFHAHEHFRRRADQLFVAELQKKFVGTGAGVLDALEQFRRAAGIGRAESLAQDHFVIIAAAHAFAHGLDFRHVLFGRVVGNDGAGVAASWRFLTRSAVRATPVGGDFAAREIVLEALDLFLLAIHEIDVVAQEQVQVLDAVARKLQLDRIELKQQIVSEAPTSARRDASGWSKFVKQRAQNRKCGRLFAAFLFGKQRGQRFQRPVQRAVFDREILPMRMIGEQTAPECGSAFRRAR